MSTDRKIKVRLQKCKDKQEGSKTNSGFPLPPIYDEIGIMKAADFINDTISEFLDYKPKNLSNKEFFDSFSKETKALTSLYGVAEQDLRKAIIKFIQPDTPEIYLDIFSDEYFITASYYLCPMETEKFLYQMKLINKKYNIKGGSTQCQQKEN